MNMTAFTAKLKGLVHNDKFRGFLKVNDLDYASFFAGVWPTNHHLPIIREKPATTINHSKKLSLSLDNRNPHWKSLATFSLWTSVVDLDLSNEEYSEFWYILARRLEKEEYERLKTEEQYQQILEKQLEQSKTIEKRERDMRNKLKSMITSFDEYL